jgi:predicted glycosyltransferase
MFIRAPDFLVGPRSADDSRFIGSRKRSFSTRFREYGIVIVVETIVGQISLSLRTSAVVGGN